MITPPLPPVPEPEEKAVVERVVRAAERARERFARELDILQETVQPFIRQKDVLPPPDKKGKPEP